MSVRGLGQGDQFPRAAGVDELVAAVAVYVGGGEVTAAVAVVRLDPRDLPADIARGAVVAGYAAV